MLQLTPAERRSLRARAHHLSPTVMIGEAGLTPHVLREIDIALKTRELVKIRVLGNDRPGRGAMLDKLCNALNAAPVQAIGRVLIIYRPKPEQAPGTPSVAARKPPRKPKRARRIKRSYQMQ